MVIEDDLDSSEYITPPDWLLKDRDINLSAVPFIQQNPSGSYQIYGTGFLMTYKNHCFVLTAKHVILDKETNLEIDYYIGFQSNNEEDRNIRYLISKQTLERTLDGRWYHPIFTKCNSVDISVLPMDFTSILNNILHVPINQSHYPNSSSKLDNYNGNAFGFPDGIPNRTLSGFEKDNLWIGWSVFCRIINKGTDDCRNEINFKGREGLSGAPVFLPSNGKALLSHIISSRTLVPEFDTDLNHLIAKSNSKGQATLMTIVLLGLDDLIKQPKFKYPPIQLMKMQKISLSYFNDKEFTF